MPEMRWTAVKITQYGHGVCSINGEACGCAVDEHTWSLTEERDAAGGKDTARYLAAGATRSLWVRTKQGCLAEAVPELRALADNGERDAHLREEKTKLHRCHRRPPVTSPRTSGRRAQPQKQPQRSASISLRQLSRDPTNGPGGLRS